MNETAGLLAEGVAHRRVGVAKAAYGDARQGVEIAFARLVPQPGALAMGEGDRQAPVGRHQGITHAETRSKQKKKKAAPIWTGTASIR